MIHSRDDKHPWGISRLFTHRQSEPWVEVPLISCPTHFLGHFCKKNKPVHWRTSSYLECHWAATHHRCICNRISEVWNKVGSYPWPQYIHTANIKDVRLGRSVRRQRAFSISLQATTLVGNKKNSKEVLPITFFPCSFTICAIHLSLAFVPQVVHEYCLAGDLNQSMRHIQGTNPHILSLTGSVWVVAEVAPTQG